MKSQDLVGQTIKSYTFIRLIGAGAWAKVYEAMNDNDRSGTFAAKVIPNKLMKETPKLQQLVKTEIRVLKDCKNQNVIRFVDSFRNDTNLYIVTQFCNGGDLEKYLDLKKNLPEDEATGFLKQILNGFKGLHEVNAMHRDFKVANVLLHNNICKIADLGFAKQMQKKSMANTILGTSLTMAPEVLEEKPYGFQADIWSIGVVYYQMLYGKYPYTGINDFDILKRIKNTKPDFSRVNISANARDFIEKCLTIDPKKRISWVQIYEHELISNKNKTEILYGLKSKFSIGSNRDFYQNRPLPEINTYPDINNPIYNPGVEFENVGNTRQSLDLAALKHKANLNKQKEQALQKYQRAYLNRRNDIMFVFKFVSPFIPGFYTINANHNIAMFILSKRAYLDIKQFYSSLIERRNIFNCGKYFQDFCKAEVYKNLTAQIQSDKEIIQAQCVSYSVDIYGCNQEIANQMDINKVHSKNFVLLVQETVDQYWFLLAEHLSSQQGDRKKDLIRVLQALYYYKTSKEVRAEEFDRLMAVIDFGQAEKDIVKKYNSIFQ